MLKNLLLIKNSKFILGLTKLLKYNKKGVGLLKNIDIFNSNSSYDKKYIINKYFFFYRKFKKKYIKNFKYKDQKKKRKYKMYPYYKCYSFIFNILLFLKKEGCLYNLDNNKWYERKHLDNITHIILKSINIPVLFVNLVSIFLKNYYEYNSIDYFFKIKKRFVLNEVNNFLVVFLIKSTLILVRKRKFGNYKKNMLSKTLNHVKRLNSANSHINWFFKTLDVSMVFIHILENIGFIAHTNKETLNKDFSLQNNIIYFVKNDINLYLYYENLVHYVYPIPKCKKRYLIKHYKTKTYHLKSKIKISKVLLNSINFIRSKPFKINKEFFKLLDLIDNTSLNNYDLPSIYSLSKDQKMIDEWLQSPCKNLLNEKLNVLFPIKRKEIKKEYTEIEIYTNNFIENKITKLNNLYLYKNYLITRKITSELFFDRKIYFDISLDYCLNSYLVPSLNLNNSNILLNIIEDYKGKFLNKESIMAFLLVYYSYDSSLLNKYYKLNKKSSTVTELKLFFF